MIGIDIIDLSCSFSQSKHSLQDYMKRILNKSEYSFCNTFSDLELSWAIKESAYKCFYKKTNRSFLNPKRILITNIDWSLYLFNACIEDEVYSGRFHIEDEYIYALCFDSESSTNTKVFLDSFNKPLNFRNELDFFTEKKDVPVNFQLHDTGFPQVLVLNNHSYSYSRSHHGSFYISAISNGQV